MPMTASTSNLPMGSMGDLSYFTEFTFFKAVLYAVAGIYVVSVSIVAMMEPFMNLPCDNPGEDLGFENPAYDGTRCPHIRYIWLLGMAKEECSFARRLVSSVLCGGLIGWERRQADRPAGIRTMSLVSLGSCLFTINSTFAFVDGPMNWDASRVSAAIPSGVGFLGAGLIFKKEEKNEDGSSHVVHGLTTAASLWLSAAVGIACGGELYFAASFGVAIMMLLLRFGPRQSENDDQDDEKGDSPPMHIDATRKSYASIGAAAGAHDDFETLSLTHSQRRLSIRKRQQANLGSIV